MKINRKMLIGSGVIGLFIITILFFGMEKILEFAGWYYVPASAKGIAGSLCVLWLCAITYVFWKVSAHLTQKMASSTGKAVISILMALAGGVLILVVILHTFVYGQQLNVKVEQYDAHIALYVEDTFSRVQYRRPHYMYEQNWLLMRPLGEQELEDAVEKYGEPENYYSPSSENTEGIISSGLAQPGGSDSILPVKAFRKIAGTVEAGF